MIIPDQDEIRADLQFELESLMDWNKVCRIVSLIDGLIDAKLSEYRLQELSPEVD